MCVYIYNRGSVRSWVITPTWNISCWPHQSREKWFACWLFRTKGIQHSAGNCMDVWAMSHHKVRLHASTTYITLLPQSVNGRTFVQNSQPERSGACSGGLVLCLFFISMIPLQYKKRGWPVKFLATCRGLSWTIPSNTETQKWEFQNIASF